MTDLNFLAVLFLLLFFRTIFYLNVVLRLDFSLFFFMYFIIFILFSRLGKEGDKNQQSEENSQPVVLSHIRELRRLMYPEMQLPIPAAFYPTHYSFPQCAL